MTAALWTGVRQMVSALHVIEQSRSVIMSLLTEPPPMILIGIYGSGRAYHAGSLFPSADSA